MRHGLIASLTLCVGAMLAASARGETLDESAPVPVARQCTLDGVFDEVRAGISTGSPAYRHYLRSLIRDAATDLDEATLRAAFVGETDPAMVEELAAALAARTDRLGDPGPLRAVAARAVADANPDVRLALTRALRGTSALEQTPDVYGQLVRDGAPAVRELAAQNLVTDLDGIYAGQNRPAAEAGVRAAVGADDPAVTARILRGMSTESLGGESARSIRGLLTSHSSEVREAAATALGGVSADEAQRARTALIALFSAEPELALRRSIIESIVRLGRGAAAPDLERMRQIEPRLAVDIAEWLQVLGLELQEWSLIVREKQRLEQARS